MKGQMEMSWVVNIYSKNKINKAGKAMIKEDLSDEDKQEYLKIIDTWRAAHSYPLYVISNKLKRMCGTNYIVVSRLKRVDSIVGKLRRSPNTSLYGMQDLGGCRVIAPNVTKVYEVIEKYSKSRIRHTLYKTNDYIENPKESGYRGVHKIYKYKSDQKHDYDNMKIEIQIRTYLQHIWATAVEVMGIVTKENLKASRGNDEYLRFFALTSSLFALIEECPVVPNTYEDKESIVKEIKEINEKYDILTKLSAISNAIAPNKDFKKKGYFLLNLKQDDINDMNLDIEFYSTSKFQQANIRYNELEQQSIGDVVLIKSESLTELKKAYPNYFVNVKEFIQYIQKEIEN